MIKYKFKNIAEAALKTSKKKDQSIMDKVINSERTVNIQEIED